jgi:hypothetical protein
LAFEALDQPEVGELEKRLLPSSDEVVLIAGQALALWADVYDVAPPSALASGVTRDYDYLGGKLAAKDHEGLLKSRGLTCKVFFPMPGDMTANTAKIVVTASLPSDEILAEIDYLGAVIGYLPADEVRLRRRAIPIEFADSDRALLVMHPVDVLKSRIHNLIKLPEKRNPIGLAQAQLAIEVAASYLQQAVAAENWRLAYQVIEAIVEIAEHNDGVLAFHNFGLDVTTAIRPEQLPDIFQERRWTQIQTWLARRRGGRSGSKGERCSQVFPRIQAAQEANATLVAQPLTS